MRVMLALLLLAVVGAGVAIALGERDEGGSFYGFRPHLPETKDEKAAAAVAAGFAHAMVRHDAAGACKYAAGDAVEGLRCTRRPRITSGGMDADPGETVGVEHVTVDGKTAGVWITGVQPGPGHDVALRRVGNTWRVVAHRAFGLA